eukprot:PhM_4_TR16226/c0_g1_i1/m.70087
MFHRSLIFFKNSLSPIPISQAKLRYIKTLLEAVPWDVPRSVTKVQSQMPQKVQQYFFEYHGYGNALTLLQCYRTSFEITKGPMPNSHDVRRKDFDVDPLLAVIKEWAGTSGWASVNQLDRELTDEQRAVLGDLTLPQFISEHSNYFQITPDEAYFAYSKVSGLAPNGYNSGYVQTVEMRKREKAFSGASPGSSSHVSMSLRLPSVDKEISTYMTNSGWHLVKDVRAAITRAGQASLANNGVPFKKYLQNHPDVYRLSADTSLVSLVAWEGSAHDPTVGHGDSRRKKTLADKAAEDSRNLLMTPDDVAIFAPYVPPFYIPLREVERCFTEEVNATYFLNGRAKPWLHPESPFVFARINETMCVRRKTAKERRKTMFEDSETFRMPDMTANHSKWFIPDEFIVELEYVLPSDTLVNINKIGPYLSEKWKNFLFDYCKWPLDTVFLMYESTFDVRTVMSKSTGKVAKVLVRSLRDETPERFMFQPTDFPPLLSFYDDRTKFKKHRLKRLKEFTKKEDVRPVEEVKDAILECIGEDEVVPLSGLNMRLPWDVRRDVTFHKGLRTLIERFPLDFHLEYTDKRIGVRRGHGIAKAEEENPYLDPEKLVEEALTLFPFEKSILCAKLYMRMPVLAQIAIRTLYGSIAVFLSSHTQSFHLVSTPEGLWVFHKGSPAIPKNILKQQGGEDGNEDGGQATDDHKGEEVDDEVDVKRIND